MTYEPHAQMKSSTVSPETAFLTPLAAALPRQGFWESPVVVGVSGGADSVALLLGLQRLAPPGRACQLIVAHAQHDLRASAGDDCQFVAALAERLALRFVTRELAVRHDTGGEGEGIEGRARRLRFRFFEDVARDLAARHVAVAHTADDQAETVLHRAFRGTGVAGLAGMAAARELCAGVALVRPLLGMPRASVRGFLVAAGSIWREDETNADTRYARNFLRHEVLARAVAGPYPAASESLQRLAQQASRAAQALASAAGHLLEVYAQRHADGTIIMRTTAIATLDPHLVAAVFVTLWDREGWPRRDMTARHFSRLAELAIGQGRDSAKDPRPVELPGGLRARGLGNGLLEISGLLETSGGARSANRQ
ncbi:MAG: tRNA lysidine(34) synthetase TilS [Planctomycetota bacterium]